MTCVLRTYRTCNSIIRFSKYVVVGGLDHTHYGTPFLRPKAYKARAGGVSPWCGIEQIRAGGTQVNPCPSQSEQYLIGSREESPPTVAILICLMRVLALGIN